MKQIILKHKNAIVGALACLGLGILTLSFQDTPYVNAILNNQQPQDTTPVKKKQHSMTMKEFDRLTNELDKQVLDEIKQVDLAKIEKEVRESLKDVDMDKMMKDIDASLKDIDVEKIMGEVKVALSNIQLDDLNENTRQSLANAKKELEKASDEIKNIDRDAIKKELENAGRELEKSRDVIKKIDLDKVMKQAREGINQAKAELKQLKQMFTEMEQDGLIDSKQGFKIEYKDKDLYINGTKQTEQVTGKYRKYFKDDHFEITIDKE